MRRELFDEPACVTIEEKIIDDDVRKRLRRDETLMKRFRGLQHPRIDDVESPDGIERHVREFRAQTPYARLPGCPSGVQELLRMSAFPYAGLAAYRTWQGVSALPPSQAALSPVRFSVGASERIATAGSCFAAYLGPALRTRGFMHYTTEGEGPFSALFGNVYTTVQLFQLLERAYGRFVPAEPAWRIDGGYADPFRPRVKHFTNEQAVTDDRARHLSAVRALFESMDVFFFTLGLTEMWHCREDGAALPVCPGNGLGEFSDKRYAYADLTVDENERALQRFIDGLRTVNPGVRVILSVTPGSLAATARDTNVLQASAYGNSVLRVVAESVCRANEGVEYFPGYDIVTLNVPAVRYYVPGSRHMTDEGVRCVLDAFFAQFAAGKSGNLPEDIFPPECDQDDLEAAIALDAARMGLR